MSATNRGAVRNPADFYPTPYGAFAPLIPYIQEVMKESTTLVKEVWEPASGDNRLVLWMQNMAIAARGDDLQNGYNFLTEPPTDRWCIVTNPPYSSAQLFVTYAVAYTKHVFMLLRLNFLGAQKRRDWWKTHEPSALFVLSERPSFTGSGTDATDYAWFYWGPTHKGIFHL